MKSKVLIFIDWFYPGFNSGGPVQSIYNITEHLADFFDFYVITRDTDYCEASPMVGIVSDEWNKINNHLYVYYCSEGAISKNLFRSLFKQVSPEVLYINGIYSYKFSILPAYVFRNENIRKIIGTRGMLAKGALNIKSTKKKFFLTLATQLGLYTKYYLHVTTPDEKSDVIDVIGEGEKILIAPNLPQKIAIEYNPTESGDVLRMVNVARISPEKNLSFALEILKNVKRQVEFDIYGPVYNKEYWSVCQALIQKLPNNIKISYKGVLNSDQVISTISDYHLFFMPTLGENFGHVILQSFMASTPVLISNKTPWKNLEQLNCGFDYDLSTPNLFKDVISNFGIDKDVCKKFREGAFLMAQNTINNRNNITLNKQLLWPNNV